VRLGDLLEEHDAVALVHVSQEVHSDYVLDEFRDASDIVVELGQDGDVVTDY